MTDPDTRELIAELAVKAAQGRSVKQAGRWAALLGFVAALAVALPVSLVVNSQNAETQRANAEFVCSQAQAAVAIQRDTFELQAASSRQFLAQSEGSAFGLSPLEFRKLIAEGEKRDAATVAALEELAADNCATEIH